MKRNKVLLWLQIVFITLLCTLIGFCVTYFIISNIIAMKQSQLIWSCSIGGITGILGYLCFMIKTVIREA